MEVLGADLVQSGISHVYVKAGDGGNVWSQFAPCVAPFQEAGLKVYGWQYVYGEDPEGEARVGIHALLTGCNGIVLDIEAECEGKHAEMVRMWEILRIACPRDWIAYAPLPIIQYHDPELYKISAKNASAVLPQFYSNELGEYWGNRDRLFGIWLSAIATWKEERLTSNLPLMPIGQAYDAATPDDIDQFAHYAKVSGCPAISFWSLDAASDLQREAVENLEYGEAAL